MSKNKDGGDWGDSEYVIEFTPLRGFDIKVAAQDFADMMEEFLQPLILHLPHVSVEFEPGCTAEEIIDGYRLAMKRKMRFTSSNMNVELGA